MSIPLFSILFFRLQTITAGREREKTCGIWAAKWQSSTSTRLDFLSHGTDKYATRSWVLDTCFDRIALGGGLAERLGEEGEGELGMRDILPLVWMDRWLDGWCGVDR